MATSTRFVPNPSLNDEIGNDPGFRRWLLSTAGEVRSGIPRQLPSGRAHGRRVRPFATRSFTELDGTGREVHVDVGTKWRLGGIIEFGSIHNPPYSPVRRAAMAAGLTLTGGGR